MSKIKTKFSFMDEEQDSEHEISIPDKEFWADVRKLMRYGIPAYDGKGHYVDLRIKVRPLQTDMISAIREKCPDGWYKSQAALCRSIIAVGCKVFLKVLGKEDKQISQWIEVLTGLNEIAKKQRLDEFKREVEDLRGSIVKGNLQPEEKLDLLNTVDKLEETFLQT